MQKGIIKTRGLLIVASLLLLLLTALSYSKQWRYLVGIEKGSYAVDREVPVEFRRASLTGMQVSNIDADPEHAGYVVISNNDHSFASNDHGDSWSDISRQGLTFFSVFWLDKKLVAHESYGILYSPDMGKTWLQLAKNQYDSEYFNLRRGKQGRLWVTHRVQDQFEDYTIESSGQTLTLEQRKPDSFEPAITYKVDIKTQGGGRVPTQYAVASIDGLWAASDAGPYFRANNSQTWQSRASNLIVSSVTTLVHSPQKPYSILTWSGGHLWKSDDYGKRWLAIPTPGYVEMANYLADGSILVVLANHTVHLIRNDGDAEISPKSEHYFIKTTQALIEARRGSGVRHYQYQNRDIDEAQFKVHALGGDANKVWVVFSDSIMFYVYKGLRQGFYTTIQQAVKSPEDDGELKRFVLFVYTPQQGWRQQPLETLKELEPIKQAPCEMSFKDHDLYINDNKAPDQQVGAVIERAGWLANDTLFYSMSDWKVEIGDIKDCQASGVVKAWQLETMVIYSSSEVFETTNGLKVVTPSRDGVTVFDINIAHPPLWRWLLYHLSFAPENVMAWCLLLVWGGLYRRAKKAALPK